MHDYLDEHQIKAVEALFELKRICDKHQIRFYLLAGTTLGAVRHEGMIPWDDDVDVGLLVEDLHKLQGVIQEELNPELGFEYAALEVESGFPRLFGKILYNRQSCIDLFVIAKWTMNDLRGAFHWNITRFCVESYYRSIGYSKPHVPSTQPQKESSEKVIAAPAPDLELEELRELQQENMIELQEAADFPESEQEEESCVHHPSLMQQAKRKIGKLVRRCKKQAKKRLKKAKKFLRKLKKLRKPYHLKKAIRTVIYKCCFFLKTEDYIRLARWNEDYFGRHGYDCYANLYSIYGMKKERIKKEWIENTSYVTFEGEQFLTVGDTDAYLTHLYGNYMQLPPEEKRVRARHAEVYARKD